VAEANPLFAKRWQRASKEEVGRAVVELCDQLEQEQAPRLNRCLEALCRYEMRKLSGLSPAAYNTAGTEYSIDEDTPLVWPIERSLANTAQAKIAGRQRPKSQVVTTDADWSTKRRAKKMDRGIEALQSQATGPYSDFWELAQRVFLDATVFPDVCAIKFTPDFENSEVCTSRVLPWELFADPLETMNANPRSLFHIYPYDRESLIAQYPDAEDNILRANEWSENEKFASARGSSRIADQVKVREAWRLPVSKTMPGRHVITIDDGTVLLDEPWERKTFGFLFLRWTWNMVGFGATSLVSEIASIADEMNRGVARTQDVVKRTSQSVLVYEEGSVNADDLATNEDAICLRITPGAQMPQYTAPPPLNEQSLEWVQLQRSAAFEFSGISQASATSRKEQGVTANSAIRTLSDMETERFSVVFKRYETMCAVDAAREYIATAREIAKENPKFAVRHRGETSLTEYKWRDIDLPDDAIDIYPVNGIKNTPADRLQVAQELNAGGKLSDDALLRVIEYLDSQQEIDRVGKQRQLIEQYIEEWLDATPQDQADGTFKFKAPIPWMPSLEDAMVQVAEAYLDAQLNKAPEFNTQFFLLYMEGLDREMTQKAVTAAQAAQGIDPNAGAPAAAAGPTGPPMPPPQAFGGPPMPAAA
jgi:hypothetical protein